MSANCLDCKQHWPLFNLLQYISCWWSHIVVFTYSYLKHNINMLIPRDCKHFPGHMFLCHLHWLIQTIIGTIIIIMSSVYKASCMPPAMPAEELWHSVHNSILETVTLFVYEHSRVMSPNSIDKNRYYVHRSLYCWKLGKELCYHTFPAQVLIIQSNIQFIYGIIYLHIIYLGIGINTIFIWSM